MVIETELLERARKLFPAATTDLEALNEYAQYTFNNLKKYYNKPKLESVYGETLQLYSKINDLRKKLKIELANKNEVSYETKSA